MVGNVIPVTAAPTGTSAPVSRESAAQVAPARAAPTGKDAPVAGEDVPAQPAASRPAVDVETTVRKLNELMAQRQRNLNFRVDEASGRTVITVLDATTKRIVRQIPAEEVLALARAIEESTLLVDARI